MILAILGSYTLILQVMKLLYDVCLNYRYKYIHMLIEIGQICNYQIVVVFFL